LGKTTVVRARKEILTPDSKREACDPAAGTPCN
jgi:hypothetical protein